MENNTNLNFHFEIFCTLHVLPPLSHLSCFSYRLIVCRTGTWLCSWFLIRIRTTGKNHILSYQNWKFCGALSPYHRFSSLNSWSHGRPLSVNPELTSGFYLAPQLLNFSPCRTKAQHNKPTKVYGALIGKQAGRDIEICNSFELDYLTTDVGQVPERFLFISISVGDPWHFFIDCKDAKKKYFFSYFFLLTCPQAHHLQSKNLIFH